MENGSVNINNLDMNQKVNYVKNLLFKKDLDEALNILLKDENKNLDIVNILLSCLNEDIFIDKIKKSIGKDDKEVRLYLYSKIISTLSFYNNKEALKAFFNSFNFNELKDIVYYEYSNNTSNWIDNKLFDKYCLKYKKEILKDNHYKVPNSKNTIIVLLIVFIFIIIGVFSYKYYNDSKLLSKYDGLIYPGIFLNDIDLSGKKESDLEEILSKEKERISNGSLIITNVNGDYKYSYKELGISFKDDNLENDILEFNENIPRYKKVSLIKNNKHYKNFSIKGEFDLDSIDNFVNELSKKINTSPRDDGLVVDENYNVSYDAGVNGFSLDIDKTSYNIKQALYNLKEETVVAAEGTVIKNEIKNKDLSTINKKISSYTTYFANAGNRGHNINLASSRLNGTVLMPGDTFSYLKVVGPYGASNGYLPAPIYLNSTVSTANGGGVCQLASTLYNAQLRAGLTTVARRNHTFAPTYVPKGLDSTVYSTTTDYKFKNDYSYPFYIVSYVKGNYLTVDIWSNENALEGKTYEPYSVYSNGGYLAYLKTIKDGKVIETKYLDKSVYKAH